jgi:predicted nucleic acid-binding protein
MTEVFLDTAYAIALATPKDPHHSQAVKLAIDLERQQTRLVTTRAVALEIGNALSKLRHRPRGVELLEFLEKDPRVDIVPLSEELYQRGSSCSASGMTKSGAWSTVFPSWSCGIASSAIP